MKKLYEDGLKDSEIATIMGCSRRWVEKWRAKNNLSSNNRRYNAEVPENESGIVEENESLYNDLGFLESYVDKKLDRGNK